MIALAICVLLCVPASPAADFDGAEYRVKAAFIYNFAKFTRWSEDKSRLCVAVLDAPQFAETLSRTLEGKAVEGIPIDVKPVADPELLASCDLAFIPAARSSSYAAIVELLRDKPVFAVGDDPEFAEAGGLAAFYLADERVRFVLNRGTHRAGGLDISSQLLRLGRMVDGEKRP
ncbi:hypothetical protein ABI59_21195 [Acidobacteria bacterium Mor1]|nr:hypothetical protein ABI59_21195 [Acidobacteria bacterium Mor1]